MVKRLTAWLLAAALATGCVSGAAAPGEDLRAAGETVRAIVLLEQAPLTEARVRSDPAAYTAQLAEEKAELFAQMEGQGVEFRVVYTFDTLVNGFSCDVAYGDLDALARLPGVKSVHIANTYAPPEPEETGPAPRMAVSNAVTGNDLTLDAGYTGQGMVVAVLDSGVNLEHEAFQVYGTVLGTPKLTEWTADDPLPEGVAAGRYYSAKIPFGYDYADGDDDPSDEGVQGSSVGHGSHVSGIAVGYAEDASGNVAFRGAAPGAQLLAMKVYKSEGGGASTDVYFKALEDALKLGADVVNLSLGVDSGFAYDSALGNETQNVFARLEREGVTVCASAGNANSQAAHSTKGYIDPLYTDYALVSAPSTYENNISVASLDNYDAPADDEEALAAALTPEVTGKMSDFSSWGPTPTLALRPTITAIGGEVLSVNWADPKNTAKYVYNGGTSMSAPNLAGTYAALLSFLAAEDGGGALSKTGRADVARQLMGSAAQVVSPQGAAPYSVRKQGVGLANSALARKAWASGWLEDPIQELGDSPSGSFSFTVTVKNNSDAPITYKPSAVLLTDSAEEKDGHWENTFTAHILHDSRAGAEDPGEAAVTVADGAETVTVAAKSEADVTVAIQPNEAGKAYFAENGFGNGSFVEGYVFFTPTEGSPDAAAVHATVLGYYGDWARLPVAETQDFRSYLDAEYRYHTDTEGRYGKAYDALTQPVTTDVNRAYTYFHDESDAHADKIGHLLGSNLMNGYSGEGFRGEVQYAPYKDSHVLFSTNAESCGYNWMFVQPSLLRNARFVVMHITGEDGSAWANYGYNPTEGGNNYVSRATYSNDGWYNHSYHHWFGKNAAGAPPADGEKATVDLDVIVPYGADAENPYGAEQKDIWKTFTGYDEATGKPVYEHGFTFTVDSTVPDILSAEYQAAGEGEDNGVLAVTVEDLHIAGVYLEEEGTVADYKLFDDNHPALNEDGSWTVEFAIPAQLEGETGSVVAYDYAFNKTAQEVTYEETSQPEPSPSPSPSPEPSPSPSPSPEPTPSPSPEPTPSPSPSPNPGGSTTTKKPSPPQSDETSVTVTRDDGTTVTTVTKSNGDKVITVADKDGGELAKLELPASIPVPAARFDDISGLTWAEEAINAMAALKIVEGVGDNKYAPLAPMTRGSLATVLHRLSQGKTDYVAAFRDVAQGQYYTQGVAWAARVKVVTGYTAEIFAPDDIITREQLAVMLARYAAFIGLDTKADKTALEQFVDGAQTSPWAADGVAWCIETGILRGKGANDLSPGAHVSRGEVAVMLDRFLALMRQ